MLGDRSITSPVPRKAGPLGGRSGSGYAKWGVRVARSDIGRGVYADRLFRRGDVILVLRGDRIDREDPIHQTEAGANLLQTGPRSYIRLDSPGLFLNHSCRPNSGIVPHRRLVAIEDIPRGEEIRFDYSTTMDEDYWTMECRCGEESCRRTIADFKYLPADLQSIYLILGIVPRFIVRKCRPEAAGAIRPIQRPKRV